MAMGAKEGKGSGSGRAGGMCSFFYGEQRISVGAPRKCELPKLLEGRAVEAHATTSLRMDEEPRALQQSLLKGK